MLAQRVPSRPVGIPRSAVVAVLAVRPGALPLADLLLVEVVAAGRAGMVRVSQACGPLGQLWIRFTE